MKAWGKRIENGRERAYGAATAAEGNVVKEMTVRHGGEKERTMLRDTHCLCPCTLRAGIYIYILVVKMIKLSEKNMAPSHHSTKHIHYTNILTIIKVKIKIFFWRKVKIKIVYLFK